MELFVNATVVLFDEVSSLNAWSIRMLFPRSVPVCAATT